MTRDGFDHLMEFAYSLLSAPFFALFVICQNTIRPFTELAAVGFKAFFASLPN
jgi:hypothetical protein